MADVVEAGVDDEFDEFESGCLRFGVAKMNC